MMTKLRFLAVALPLSCSLASALRAADVQDPESLARADQDFQRAVANWGDGTSIEAEKLLNEALAIRESQLGSGHPGIAEVLERLGAIDFNRHQYAAAETKFRRAAEIDRAALGERNVVTALALADLGAALREERRYSEAEPIAEEALAIRRALLPADDFKIGRSLDGLARIYLGEHRYAKARDLVDEKLRIDQARTPPDRQALADDEALIATAEQKPDRLHRLVLWAAGTVAISVGLIMNLQIRSERLQAFSAFEPSLPVRILLRIARIGLLVGALLIGAVATDWVLDQAAPSFMTDSTLARGIGKVGGVFGVWIAVVLQQLLLNAGRSASGLPTRPVVLFGSYRGAVDSADRVVPGDRRAIRKAIGLGVLCVNIPAVALTIAGMALAVALVLPAARDDPYLHAHNGLIALLGLAGIALGMIPGWLWWSVMVPRWRIWAMRRVGDVVELERRAIAIGLVWNPSSGLGRLFERTELWTAEQRAEAQMLRAKQRAQL